ncbi:serine hydrolase domain-containing protein [Undibacterium sp.]|jgi:CubicO group peptidase (beta-lactamase class C family)|uniref:serine hydrolase domain-containing protein n=1 Tax=Undibacterium sp. TaxID=1914977 RepID=UPI002BA77BF8|nr:serine hydrolase domain-containing protein [Undibacterium sp.]HTD04621.1 serine hydrolase domain-containing protein [Undibacterium sp.]
MRDMKFDTYPESAGFSATALQQMTSCVQADIDAGKIPGAVMLISRKEQLAYAQALGRQGPDSERPMSLDSIFRIYSMTKPVVSIAIMMLVEQGCFLISDPVSRYLPELKDLQVGVAGTNENGQAVLKLEAARQEMTIQDLLRHTSGLTYGIFGESLVKDCYRANRVDAADISNAELVRRLATVPLAYQPGTVWEYSRSTDVLGALIERISGLTLDVFLEQRIFAPLKMPDTGFWVPQTAQHRIAEAFAQDPETGVSVMLSDIKQRPQFLSGGGGLVSTAADYLRFARMLLNHGQLDGVRIIARKTLEFMRSDHLGELPLARAGASYLPGPGYGFGLGFAVRLSEGGTYTPGSVGDYNWSGLAGTYFWIDPQQEMIAIWLMQAPEARAHYRQLYRNLVYAALL